MTSSDNDMAQSIDEVEDLTRFADEAFDTDEVDLFEFTGVDDSPLTRLKSIILSLDWEISDDILEELTDEVTNLRKMWDGDKVAQVYLQGIEKVGKYLRVEGAYAHPNAMKLLLTLFYNYEKIISSPNINGDEITALLKSDIRKFKVLQYQIGKQAPTASSLPSSVDTRSEAQTPKAENELDVLADLNATILGLEWEVTEEGLDRFNKQASQLQVELADNESGLVLVNGLQALGAYIKEEKVKAHPDSFTLLHSFFDGLKLLLHSQHMPTEKRQEILIDRVSKLNALKEIIAGAAASGFTQAEQFDKVDQILDFEESEEVVATKPQITPTPDDIDEGIEDAFESPATHGDEENLNLDFDLDQTELYENDDLVDELEDVSEITLDDEVIDIIDEPSPGYVSTAMETKNDPYPADILDPGAIRPVSDTVADDFIEEELRSQSSISSITEITPDDTSDFAIDDEALSADELDDELELLFGSEEIGDDTPLAALSDNELDDLELDLGDVNIDETDSLDFSDALKDVDLDEASDLSLDDDLFIVDDELDSTSDQKVVTSALADIDDLDAPADKSGIENLRDESTSELEGQIDSLFGSAEDEEPVETTSKDFDSIIPALDDTDEESGFREEIVAEGIAEDPSADLEGRLDSFFGISDEEPDIEDQDPPAASLEPDYIEADDDFVVAALSDADEDLDGGFQEDKVVAELDEDPSNDLQDKLDSFFGSDDEEPEPAESVTEPVSVQNDVTTDEPPLGGIDSKLDSLFGGKTAVATAALSLGAIAAKLSAKPSTEELEQVSQLVTEKKNDNPSSQETVILTLINSATELLAENDDISKDSGTIIKELTADLDDAENPAVMVAAVERFTVWQKKMFDKALQHNTSTVVKSTTKSTVDIDAEIASQVKDNFSQLRDTLLNEFAEIRKELKKE